MRNYFTFYRSYYEAVQDLPNEQKLEIYEMIMQYMFEDKQPKLSGVTKLAYTLIRPTLEKSKKLSENGKRGGGQIGNQNAKKNKN